MKTLWVDLKLALRIPLSTTTARQGDVHIHVCQGLNSHYFHIVGDGHQPNSRGLYTHYKDSLLKGGMAIPNKTRLLTISPCQVLNATAICLTFAVFLFGLVVSQAEMLVDWNISMEKKYVETKTVIEAVMMM